ncbi:unnamed protein product, partial [Rhizoctonia solani]
MSGWPLVPVWYPTTTTSFRNTSSLKFAQVTTLRKAKMNTESTRLVSVHSTSVTGTTVSNIESATSLNNKRSDTESVGAENQQSAPVHPEFAFFDDHIEIRTVDQTFWVHEYRLSKFTVFATLIQSAKSSGVSDTGRVIVTCGEEIRGEDIYNTLKVIYASHIDGIPDFDSSTMISTLRIASSFDYPALRKFAISKLEGMNLPAIQRIQLSDEFSLPTWETPAFTELCSRKEPVSQAEAEVLGIARFVEIARIRETERTRLAVKFTSDMYGELLQATNATSSSQAAGSDESSSGQNHF